MAQHDYEKQPEAPDLGAAVQLNTSDSLEGPVGDVDGLDAGYSPPDRPYALDEPSARSRRGQGLEERLTREQPEVSPVDLYRAGRLSDPGQGAALERADAMEGVDVGVDGGAASAEEAAVHIIEVGDRDGLPPEGSGTAPDPEDGLLEGGADVMARNRGSGRTGRQPDPAYPHGGERDRALPDPTST